jgi:hypothetical protein
MNCVTVSLVRFNWIGLDQGAGPRGKGGNLRRQDRTERLVTQVQRRVTISSRESGFDFGVSWSVIVLYVSVCQCQ